MKNSKRILGDVLSNWLRYLVAAVVSFMLVPRMTGAFGAERYGLWTLASSLLGFLLILDGGFGTGVVKWTAEARKPEDMQRRDELLSTALLVHYLAAAVGCALLFILAAVYGRLFSIPGDLVSAGRVVFLLLGFRAVVVGIPGGFFRGLVFGSGKLLYVNAIQIASSLVYGFLCFRFLDSGISLSGLAAIGLGTTLAENIAYVLLSRIIAPEIRISLKKASRARFREAFSFSGASFAVQISGVILMQSDVVLLKLFAPLAAVAKYGVAQRAAEYAFMLVKQVVNALTPPIARLDTEAEPEKARFFLINASKYSGGFAAIFAVAMIILGAPALSAWAGPEYGDAAPILAILMVSFVIIAVQMPCAAVLSLKGDHVYAAKAMVASTLLNIAASVVLVIALGPGGLLGPDSPYGPLGVALGTLIAASSVDGFAIPLRSFRRYGIRKMNLLSRVWFPILVPSLVEGLVIALIAGIFHPETLGSVFLAGFAGALGFIVAFWIFSLDSSERDLFTVFLRKKGRKS
jgi:O-antigen/teichoic acid export membrane protein